MKKYYKHRGKCYGWADKVKTVLGEVPFSPHYCLLRICFWVIIALSISFLLGCLFDSIIIDFSPLAIIIAFFGGIWFEGARGDKCCVHCSTEKDVVKQLVETACSRNPELKNKFSDIQYIDGLYMVFLKSKKELYNDMLNSPNTYTRPYPKEFKRARSILFIVAGVLIAACFGVVYACSAFNVARRLSEVLWVLPLVLVLLPWVHYCKVVRKYKDKFRKEENFPLELYRVTVKCDKNDGGRFIYIVEPKNKQG